MEDVRPESGARRGSGSHRRGSCDLANRSSELEPSKTSPPLLPRREVQACQQRQVPLQKCLQNGQNGDAGHHPGEQEGPVLH